MKFTRATLSLLVSSATAVRGFVPGGAPRLARSLGRHPIAGASLTTNVAAASPYSQSFLQTNGASVAEAIDTDELLSTYNQQITNELTASQLYLSASLWCERRELVGMAEYMRGESSEERGHAMQFIEFANKRNMPVQLRNLEAPPHEWESVTALWEHLLQAEQDNTRALQTLAQVAGNRAQDAPTAKLLDTFLDPFFLEQMDSENELRKIVAKVRDMEGTPGLLRQLDAEFGNQVSN